MNESKWFKEGEQAFKNGVPITDCPYAVRSPKWFIWREGWQAH